MLWQNLGIYEDIDKNRKKNEILTFASLTMFDQCSHKDNTYLEKNQYALHIAVTLFSESGKLH